ncbi:MAG: HAD family hydrolase [Deltaproteobacteria bacterium]|nr:HAD family hydrolase [Deltaproteobacteria bacterium]
MPEPLTKFPTLTGAVFIDRDGTIIHEVDYLSNLAEIKLLPRAAEAIAKLNQLKIPVILVTNQSGVARGKFTEEFVKQSHIHLNQLLALDGARIDDFFYCPHHPEAGLAPYKKICDCRKPRSGLLHQAANRHHLDLETSFVIGDKLIDVKLAQNVKAKGILVETGYGRKEKEKIETLGITPDQICTDLADAVNWLLSQRG